MTTQTFDLSSTDVMSYISHLKTSRKLLLDTPWAKDITRFYKQCKVLDCNAGFVKFKPYRSEATLLKKFANMRKNDGRLRNHVVIRSETVW